MLRQLVAAFLMLVIAVGDAEAALTRGCDDAAEMAVRANEASSPTSALKGRPADERGTQSAPTESDCHCAHAHVQSFERPVPLDRAASARPSAPIRLADRAPSSAERALLLRPPRA